jgi:hypothetical protein
MRVRSLFSKELKSSWTYHVPEGWIVWKLVPASTSVLVIDERNPNNFKSRICAIDLASGKELWQTESPFGDWWSNLTAVSGDRAILEGYTSPDMPIPKGVATLALNSGNRAWMDSEAQLLEIAQGALKVRRVQYGIERVEWISLADGSALPNKPHALAPESSARSPDECDGEEIARVLSSDDPITGPVECLSAGAFEIFAYHRENARDAHDLMRRTFRCELLVTKGETRVLRETIAAHSPFPVAGNFVVESDILIYVQEKTRIVGVHLT